MGTAQDYFNTTQGPTGSLVSDNEYVVNGNRVLQFTTILSGGTATIAVDNGIGYTVPADIVEGASLYDLSNCTYKVVLTGGATVGVS